MITMEQQAWPLSARRQLAWSNMDTLVHLPSEVSQLGRVYRKELARADVDRPITTDTLQLRVVDQYAWSSTPPKRQLACMIHEARQVHKQHDVLFARWADHGRALFTVDNTQQGVLWQCTHYLNCWKPVYKMRFSSPLLAHAWLSTERQYAGNVKDGVLERLYRLPWMGPRNPWGGHAFITLSTTGQIAVYYQETRDKYQTFYSHLIDPTDEALSTCEFLAGDICLWSDGQVLVSVIYRNNQQWHQSLYQITIEFDNTPAITSNLLWTTSIQQHLSDTMLSDTTIPLTYWTRLSTTPSLSNSITLLTLISPIVVEHAIDTSKVMIWQLENMQLNKETAFSLPNTLITSCDVDQQGAYWCIGTMDGRLELRSLDTTANTTPTLTIPTEQMNTPITGTILDLCFSPNGCAIAFTRDINSHEPSSNGGDIELASFHLPSTQESTENLVQSIANRLCLAMVNGVMTSDLVHQFEKYTPVEQLADDLQKLFIQTQTILANSFPSNVKWQHQLFLTIQQSLLGVCALDKVKRMNIQFISQYRAVLAKWDACILDPSKDFSNLSTDITTALTREAIWIVEIIVFLFKDLHTALSSLKFGQYKSLHRAYHCSLLFHQMIRENLVKILGHIKILMQHNRQDTSKSSNTTISLWMNRLDNVFSHSTLSLDNMISLLSTDLPSRIASLDQGTTSTLNQSILARFTLPSSIVDSDEWRVWVKHWFDQHTNVLRLYQYTPSMDSPFSLNHSSVQPVGISVSHDLLDWSMWWRYFTQQQDQLTHLPLKMAKEIRFCIRCGQPAASLTEQPNGWPMFNDHCPCGGVWWCVDQSTIDTRTS
ncbi:hypothetical protein BDF22DRAFT_681447 [Syncephalis plumigaleata]|nr:hypothetical protein BDF22DRAFT_681447 [Syncephalis plumigaleata]